MGPTYKSFVEAHFQCAACDQQAGHIQLFGSPTSSEVRRTSFTSALISVVPAQQFHALQAIITRGDARALYKLDVEYAPFYCPQCNCSYCGVHWKQWDVFDPGDPTWHDSIRGKCPKGHERMLED